MSLVTPKEVSKVINLDKYGFIGTFFGWLLMKILRISAINKIYNKQFVILKETKHFVSYNGDLDSDESDYEDAVDLYYRQQMKKYDKIMSFSLNNELREIDQKFS